MDLIDKLKQISERIAKVKDQVQTEEATKNAFVLPFIQALGYDVFNPLEVNPEFTADIGIKKGEKVDYCILKDRQPAILIECKHWSQKLDTHASQLHRYFHVTPARFAILTNGIRYQFFTDLINKNVMDSKPFHEFSMDNLTEVKVAPVKQFHKESFDVEAIFDSASELKYTKEIKDILYIDLNEPSEDFVKYFVQKVYSGRATVKVMDQFREIVKKSVKNLIGELINEKLQYAIDTNLQKSEALAHPDVTVKEDQEAPKNEGVETTDEEIIGYRIVQAILSKKVAPVRIAQRDVKTYFGILLDDNNRKPICRLHFNGVTKYIGLFDLDKNERKEAIESPEDIYKFSDELLKVVEVYEGK